MSDQQTNVSTLAPASVGVVRIGDPVSRVDGRAKVTGIARYAAEHPVDDLLYGWVVSSSIAKGRIVSIDESAARMVPGVIEVMTHKNRPKTPENDKNYSDDVAPPGSPFRALWDDSIKFSAQPIALVLAEDLETARYGASLIRAEYEAEPHNTNIDRAIPESFEPKKKRSMYKSPKSRGDAETAFASAPLKVAGDYRMATHHHNPMEMHAATVVWEGNERITVYDKTQGSQGVQNFLAAVFGFAEKNVRVHNPYVGGAFGAGLRPHYYVYLAVLAAKMLERSVRVVLTRQQMFSHVHRPETLLSIGLAADTNGKLQAIINDAVSVSSRFEDYMETICDWGLKNYACENASASHRIAPMDTYTPGDMRAPGAATGMTLFEMAIDEMAVAANVDPLAFRLINYSDKDAMEDKPFTSKALREAYEQGAARFGWSKRSAAPRSMTDGNELTGWGMATGMWEALFVKSTVRATLKPDGRLQLDTAASDIGTGTYTIMSQMASDTLGMPLDSITSNLGDSAMPTSPLEGGSWTAASTGAAVQMACKAVGEKVLKATRKIKGDPLGDAKIEQVVFANGRVTRKDNPERSIAIQEVLAAGGLTEIMAEETAGPGVSYLASMMRKSRNTHSAIFAEVKVDAELGVVRVTRVVIAVAAGRILNAKTARSQVLGGVVMGIGMALHEETLMDHHYGRFMNHSFAEYHIPVNADIDRIEVIFVDEVDPEVSPLGVKGLGEIGIVGTAAAVANAIFHATGKRIRSLPVTLDKLL